MSLGIENIHRSNHSIFFPQSYGSPLNDITKHISGLPATEMWSNAQYPELPCGQALHLPATKLVTL
jgi:hypothetical protein